MEEDDMSDIPNICLACGVELEFRWDGGLCMDCWRITQEDLEEDAMIERQERLEEEDDG